MSALIDSAGDGNVAIEAFKLHLLAMFEDVDGGAALASHILASVDTCFISGDAAMPYTIRYLEEHIDMRKATAEDDPAYEDKMAEVEMIKAYLVDLVPPKPSATAATPASKGAREQTSPDSLGEAATPVERKMYSKMKEVETKLGAGFDGCEERDEHMLALNKMQLQQMDEDRAAREQQRHDDAVAAQEAKEQREDAERKAQREAERKAIQDRKEDAAARAQALKDTYALITSSLKQQSVENRSFQKTMAKIVRGRAPAQRCLQRHQGVPWRQGGRARRRVCSRPAGGGRGAARRAHGQEAPARRRHCRQGQEASGVGERECRPGGAGPPAAHHHRRRRHHHLRAGPVGAASLGAWPRGSHARVSPEGIRGEPTRHGIRTIAITLSSISRDSRHSSRSVS